MKIAKRCTVDNTWIRPWWFKNRAAKLQYRDGSVYYICSDECYMTLFSAYEEGMAFIYVYDPDWH